VGAQGPGRLLPAVHRSSVPPVAGRRGCGAPAAARALAVTALVLLINGADRNLGFGLGQSASAPRRVVVVEQGLDAGVEGVGVLGEVVEQGQHLLQLRSDPRGTGR